MSTSHFTTTEKFENKIKKLASDYNMVFAGANEVQTLSITGTPTGGNFTITYAGQTTASIAYNASAAIVETALKALSNIGDDDVECVDGDLPGTPVVITFIGDLAAQDIVLMTVTDSLTGGTSPESAVEETTKGGSVDSSIALRRLENSYEEILGALMDRGLSVVEISTWARGEEFQLDIAIFWYAKDSGWGGKLVDEVDWTKVFDRREELKTVAIINNDGALLLSGKAVAAGQDLIATNEALGIYS